ncbi:MAG: hypothetical protein PHV19_00235 [Bacilli bacterium]|jgi:predicted neutral ceramidase superfamily lipid hydrolase|nr:hypothetical protein [Bacilli bacterium]
MNFLKKYGPYLSIALIVLALGFLFLPYIRTGDNNIYYANGYMAIFNIKESGLPSTVTNKGGPSVMLIIAFVLSVLSLIALPFYKKDVVLTLMSGIALSASGVIFFLAHLILFVNLRGAIFVGTFGLYLVASLITLAGLISLLIGIQYLKEHNKNESNSRYSYIRK